MRTLCSFASLILSMAAASAISEIDNHQDSTPGDVEVDEAIFPFNDFNLTTMGNTTALFTFPIPKFSSPLNLSVTVDTLNSTMSTGNESQDSGRVPRLLVYASICEGREGRLIFNSSIYKTDYIASESAMLPKSLMPDDMHCRFNASEPIIHVEVKMEEAPIKAGEEVSGTVALRLAEEGGTSSGNNDSRALREELFLPANQSKHYPLGAIFPEGGKGAVELEVGVRKGRVEIWLASTNPYCVPLPIRPSAVNVSKESIASGTEHQISLPLLKLGEVARGDVAGEKELEINASVVKEFRRLERMKCSKNESVENGGGSPSSRELNEKVETLLDTLTTHPIHIFPPALVVLSTSNEVTSVYSIYSTHHPHHHPAPPSFHFWIWIPILVTASLVGAMFAALAVFYYVEKRKRTHRRILQREVIILKGIRAGLGDLNTSAGNNGGSGGSGASGINEGYEGASLNGVASDASTATAAETSFGGGAPIQSLGPTGLATVSNDQNGTNSGKNSGLAAKIKKIPAGKGISLNAWK